MTKPPVTLPTLMSLYAEIAAHRRNTLTAFDVARYFIQKSDRAPNGLFVEVLAGPEDLPSSELTDATRSLVARLETACGCVLRQAAGTLRLADQASKPSDFQEPRIFRFLKLLALGYPDKTGEEDGFLAPHLVMGPGKPIEVWLLENGVSANALAKTCRAAGLTHADLKPLREEAQQQIAGLFGYGATVRLELVAGHSSAHAGLAARWALVRLARDLGIPQSREYPAA